LLLPHITAPNFNSTLGAISGGKPGTLETLKIMRKIVIAWKTNPEIRSLAIRITSDIPGKDFAGEISAVQNWVRSNIRYVQDVNGVETLQTPDVTLTILAGDCDDQSILVACLLESIGHPTRFFAMGFSPGEMEHVFTQTRLGAGWASVETTEPVDIGWMPPGIADTVIVHNS